MNSNFLTKSQEAEDLRYTKSAQGSGSMHQVIQGFFDQSHSPLSTYISNFNKQRMIISSGEDSSAQKTANKYAHNPIPPYSDIKTTKDGTFLSSPDAAF